MTTRPYSPYANSVCGCFPQLLVDVNRTIEERLQSLAQVEIISNVEWSDMHRKLISCSNSPIKHAQFFGGLTATRAAEEYPGVYAVLVVSVAAEREHAGKDNSLWRTVCKELGLKGEDQAGRAFSKAVDRLRSKTNSPLVRISNSNQPHVMLANVHTAVPSYAVQELWNKCIMESETMDSVLKRMRQDGSLKEPLRHFAENAPDSEYLKHILNQLLYGKSRGLFSMEKDAESRYTSILLYGLNFPSHMTAALSKLDTIRRGRRPDALNYGPNEAKISIRPALGWENYDTPRWTLAEYPSGKQVTEMPSGCFPLLYHLDGTKVRAVTSEEKERGLLILIEDDRWLIEEGSAYPLIWSETASLSIKRFTLYRTYPGKEPLVWAADDPNKEAFPFTNHFESDNEGAYKNASGGMLPPEVSLDINGKNLALYTRSPSVLALKAEARIGWGRDAIKREMARGDDVFNTVISMLKTDYPKRNDALQVISKPFSVFAHRVDGIREYTEGALMRGVELQTPTGCGEVLGIPFVGNNVQSEKPAMEFWLKEKCIPVKATKRGDKHIAVSLADIGVQALCKIKLVRARWYLENLLAAENTISVQEGLVGRECTTFAWGSSFGWLNTNTVGWPAQLIAFVTSSNGHRRNVELTPALSINPCYRLGNWTKLKLDFGLDSGPRGPASPVNVTVQLRYYFPHLETYKDMPLFEIGKTGCHL